MKSANKMNNKPAYPDISGLLTPYIGNKKEKREKNFTDM
jgi:hypothetical protein